MNALQEIKETQEIVNALMHEPHYAKLGKAGIMAIVSMAKSLNIDPLKGLNGALYFVNGKVEMSASMMNSLIRNQQHSITKGNKSDKTICILHGKRSDNGDTWMSSFSIEDAKKAGLLNMKSQHSPWIKYTEDMLYARALSRLARQLFADVICGCYVEGEIPRNELQTPVKSISPITIDKPEERRLTPEEYQGLLKKLERNLTYKRDVLEYFQKKNKDLSDITISAHDRILSKLELLPTDEKTDEKIEPNIAEAS